MKCITGGTDSGKSFFLIWYLLQAIHEGEKWVTVVLPHRPAAVRLIAELFAYFGEALLEFLVVEDLDQVKKVVMRRTIHASADPDPWERRRQNEEFLGAHQERLILRRPDVEHISGKPNLARHSATMIRAAQHQDQWFPESEAPKMLRPLSRWWRYFAHHCTDEAARDDLVQLMWLPPREWPMTVTPTENLLAGVHGSVLLAARTCRPPKLGTAAFLNGGHTGARPGVRVYFGGAGSPEALRTFVGCDVHETAALALSGALGPGIYAIDEFGNYGFCSNWMSQKAATLRFTGTELVAVQHAFDWVTEAGRKWNQQCDHYLFNLADADNAEYGAKLLRGSYDRMAVHHEDEVVRTGTDVRYEEQVSVTELPDGKKSTTRRTVPVHVPGQWTTKKPVYESGGDQQFWRSGELMGLPQRACWVKPLKGAPYFFTVPEVEDSWGGDEAIQEACDECLRRLTELPVYETPVLTTVPDEPMPPEVTPDKPKPKPKPQKPSSEAARKLGKPRGNK